MNKKNSLGGRGLEPYGLKEPWKSKKKKNKPIFNPFPSLHFLSKKLNGIRRHG